MVNDAQTHPQPMVIGQVSVTGVNPVFAYKANGRINVERVNVNGSSFTFYLRAQSGNAIGLQYWIFDTAATATRDPTMAGIVAEIRDEYGVVTFDGTMAAMRVWDGIETPKTSSSVPFGTFVNLADTTTITVPSGKVYAIVQATPSFVFTTFDQGGYSNSENPPNIPIRDPGVDDPGGGNYRWRQQELQSYHSTGGYTGANTIEVGLTKFEDFYLGWQPMNSTPFIQVHGQARHLIIDVTNFTSAGGISPTIINVGVNASTRSVTNGGATTISQSTTPAVTASPSGGSGSYSYLWQFVEGDSSVSPNGSSTGQSFSTTTYNQPAGTIRRAKYRCRVTDSGGFVGYSQDVTFEHTAQEYTVDVTPDPFAIGHQSYATNENTIWNGPVQTISGINQTITLRFQSYDPAGWMDGFAVHVYRDVGGGWVHMGSLDPRSGNPYVDFTVTNGNNIHYAVSGSTNSGRQEFAFTMVIFNGSAGWPQLSNHRVTTVVDADNNYNVADYSANQIALSNLTISTNDSSQIVYSPGYQITGTNQTITLRIATSGLSGSFAGGTLYFLYTTDHGNYTYRREISWTGTSYYGQSYADVEVPPGFQFQFAYYGATDTGARWSSVNCAVYNLSDGGALIGSFTASGTVDADNNYNVGADVTPNPVAWSNISYNEQFGGSVTHISETQYFTGISAPITVRVTGDQLFAYGQGASGGWSNSGFYIYPVINESTAGGHQISYGNWGGDPSQQSFDMTIPPNAAVYFVASFSVSDQLGMSASGSGGGTFTVTNQSTGGTVLDSFTVNLSANEPGSGGPGNPWEPGGPIIVP